VVNLLFYLMALGAVAGAIGVVVARNPVVSIVSLLGAFFSLSVTYLLAGYPFLAAIQILVYGGAVMVLFLFVVMLLNLGDPAVAASEDSPLFHRTGRALGGLGVAVALGAAGLIAVLRGAQSLPVPEGGLPAPAEALDPLEGLATEMFTRYALPFEAASVLLLAATVGVLVLAKRNRPAADKSAPRSVAQPVATPAAPEKHGEVLS
jgi:NADH-quinone oxidoreductase subunit J